MRVGVHPFDLRLLHPFTTSHGTKTTQRTLLLSLEEEGIVGYGEVAESPVYGITIENMCQEIASMKALIEGTRWRRPEALHEAISGVGQVSSFSCCALDMAMHDWYGKYMGKSLRALWGLPESDNMISSFTIGMDTPEMMRKKMEEMAWPIYKIKVGGAADISVLQLLRAHTTALFRIDANCGWNKQQTITACPVLRDLGVELIEQPLPVRSADHEEVFQKACLPIVADESCLVEADIVKCVGRFHGVNIKLGKAGGLTPALRMIKQAKAHKLKVMVGCMVESSVGISAIAHLLPLLDYVDMDGALLIANDPAEGVKLTPAGVVYAKENGTGARITDALGPSCL